MPGTATAVAPVAVAPGVLVHSRRDRELAAAQWLLLSAPETGQARHDWVTHGIALLRCGRLFSAVRIPAVCVQEAAGTDVREGVAAFLERTVEGPVFYDGGGRQFYALVPRSAASRWAVPGIECLGRDHFLGVPATDLTAPNPRCTAYWSVPMNGPAALCPSAGVARLVLHGLALVAKKEAEDDD